MRTTILRSVYESHIAELLITLLACIYPEDLKKLTSVTEMDNLLRSHQCYI